MSLVLEPAASLRLIGQVAVDGRALLFWTRPAPCGLRLKSGQQLLIPFSVSETLFLI
jgi:hypothetical protein